MTKDQNQSFLWFYLILVARIAVKKTSKMVKCIGTCRVQNLGTFVPYDTKNVTRWYLMQCCGSKITDPDSDPTFQEISDPVSDPDPISDPT